MKNYKNIISTFLATCILVSNIWVLVSLHFCEGNIKSVSLFETKKTDTCCSDTCCDEDQENEGCCDSKTILIKKTTIDYFETEKISFYFFALSQQIYTNTTQIILQHLKSLKLNKHFIEGNAPPLFILFSSLIFYQ